MGLGKNDKKGIRRGGIGGGNWGVEGWAKGMGKGGYENTRKRSSRK